jgi:hypothetical protein
MIKGEIHLNAKQYARESQGGKNGRKYPKNEKNYADFNL